MKWSTMLPENSLIDLSGVSHKLTNMNVKLHDIDLMFY